VVPVLLLTNFSGVVIAPDAAVTLSQPLFGSYAGAFFAQDVHVAAGVRVAKSPFGCH